MFPNMEIISSEKKKLIGRDTPESGDNLKIKTSMALIVLTLFRFLFGFVVSTVLDGLEIVPTGREIVADI